MKFYCSKGQTYLSISILEKREGERKRKNYDALRTIKTVTIEELIKDDNKLLYWMNEKSPSIPCKIVE